MYPFVRFAWVLAAARRRPSIGPDEVAELRLTAWPWDCDPFIELNNGRTVTLFDLGRFDHGVRIGFMKILRREGWGLTVAGSSLHYRKRIRPFQRFTLRTQLIARDARWFYFVQTTWRGETPCSQGLLRTGVLDPNRGVVPTDEVAAALGYPEWRPPLPDWARAWADAEAARPWPPSGP